MLIRDEALGSSLLWSMVPFGPKTKVRSMWRTLRSCLHHVSGLSQQECFLACTTQPFPVCMDQTGKYTKKTAPGAPPHAYSHNWDSSCCQAHQKLKSEKQTGVEWLIGPFPGLMPVSGNRWAGHAREHLCWDRLGICGLSRYLSITLAEI